MTDVLCFGDSNTWGYNPKDGSRFSWEIRWTGRLQKELQGDGIRVLEEGLCGRTTIFEMHCDRGAEGRSSSRCCSRRTDSRSSSH